MNEQKLEYAKNKVNDPNINISIGIQKEKILHKILKYYIEEDNKYHEIRVDRMYADIKVDSHIYEIQTQNFNMLRHKLDVFLPSYQVTIVYPASRIKTLYVIDENGELVKTSKSPKKGTPFSILPELYKIKNYLTNSNLNIKVIYLDMDEYRTQTPKKHYRSKGYERYKQVPLSIVKEYELKDKDDYIKLLDEYDIMDSFKALDFSKITKLSYHKATAAIQTLKSLDVIKLSGKDGRKNIWKVNR